MRNKKKPIRNDSIIIEVLDDQNENKQSNEFINMEIGKYGKYDPKNLDEKFEEFSDNSDGNVEDSRIPSMIVNPARFQMSKSVLG